MYVCMHACMYACMHIHINFGSGAVNGCFKWHPSSQTRRIGKVPTPTFVAFGPFFFCLLVLMFENWCVGKLPCAFFFREKSLEIPNQNDAFVIKFKILFLSSLRQPIAPSIVIVLIRARFWNSSKFFFLPPFRLSKKKRANNYFAALSNSKNLRAQKNLRLFLIRRILKRKTIFCGS